MKSAIVIEPVFGEEYRDGKRWTISKNGKRIGPMHEFTCQLVEGGARFTFIFDENTLTNRTLDGTLFISKADTILLDGEPMPSADIVISHRFTLRGPIGIIEFKFTEDNIPVRYRFDVKLM